MKKLISIIVAVTLILALQGCGNSNANGSGGGGLKNEKVDNYSVKINYDGKELKSYTIDDIKKMPAESFDLNGSTEKGPSISSILAENNIKEYSEIKFIGMMTDSIILTKEQVEKGTLLDITNHNTVKLASKSIDKNNWVKDIAAIQIKK